METEFVCNVCGSPNRAPAGGFDRERPTCTACGSNVRMRGLLHALSQELFGANLTLPEFPRVKSLRGLGLSDSVQYADTLAARLDYRNTFFHREPHFDITKVSEAEYGRYDFVLASEVFEHVPPPAEHAFTNGFRLLRDGGVLVFTVPDQPDEAWYFDAQTGLLVRRDYHFAWDQGQDDYEWRFDDYRHADGVLLPFWMKELSPSPLLIEVTHIQHNLDLADSLFDRPTE